MAGAVLAVVLAVTGCAQPANLGERIDIHRVAAAAPSRPAAPDASTGTVTEDCGLGSHRNADNVITAPRIPGGAEHTHDYVGNLTTDAWSTNDSLAVGASSCRDGDQSALYWPVLRTMAGGQPGKPLSPAAVLVRFQGNPLTKVVAMPRFLRVVTGNSTAVTDHGAHAHPQWSCTGFADRRTTSYPICPPGSAVLRIFDFPSCWNGLELDSADHRGQIVFPGPDGACPRATFPVPQLHVEVSYSPADSGSYVVDAMPRQGFSSTTDHADFIDAMTAAAMANLVDCINSGRTCSP